jgi:hypothetical protein
MNKNQLRVIAHNLATREDLLLAEQWIIHDLLREVIDRPEIVILCGPTRFGALFHEANLKETLSGSIVLLIGCDTKSDEDLLLVGARRATVKEMLDLLHFYKIKMGDRALFLNGLKGEEHYLGESSLEELAYARDLGKTIEWYNYPTKYARKGEGPWRLK